MNRTATATLQPAASRVFSTLTTVGLTLRNLYRQPVRTGLTVIGVSVGVMAIVAFNTTVRGLHGSMEKAIKTGGASMMVYQKDAVADILSVLEEDETREALLSDPEVSEVAAGLFAVKPVEMMPFSLLFGIHHDEFIRGSAEMYEGARLETLDEVVLGSNLAAKLGKGTGDTIIIAGQEFKISGVFHTEIVFFNSAVVMLLPRLQEMLGKEGQVTTFMIRLKDGADVKTVAARLEQNIQGIAAITGADDYSKVDQGLTVAQTMVWVIALLTVFIGGIIVMNTMWMTVMERTREIGVLRAVGWSRGRIMRMILIEAAGVGVLAFLLGTLAGVVLAEISTLLPVTSQFVSPVYDWPPFMLAASVAIVLSLLGAAIPAVRATRVSPAEALRYE
jgi:putative ABC transport system permease protein